LDAAPPLRHVLVLRTLTSRIAGEIGRTEPIHHASGHDVETNGEDVVRVIGDPLLRPRPRTLRAGTTLDVAQLYREHRRQLVNLAAAITLDRPVAEEVVHDAFAGLQRRARAVDEPVRYLHRSVVNRAIAVIRRRRTASKYLLPQAAVIGNPEIDETWTAVCRLPVRERSVVVLRYWLDWPEVDIAASLGWPAGTVKSTLHRALRRLEKELPE
jgi:RNA polymerase sigma factor (sigma-70 family)